MQDAPFQAQAIHTTYQATILHCWNEIQPFLHRETAISHGHCKMAQFEFLPPEKLWQKSPFIKSSHNPLIPHNFANCLGVPPQLCTFFMYTYVMIPPPCEPTPSHNHSSYASTWHMCETPQQPCNFPTSLQNFHALPFRSLPCTATQKCSSTIHLLAFLALAFTMVNLLLLCNIKFTSSTSLSWLSFRYQTGMQVFYITPALCFWFIVVSSVFQLFSFLDRFSLIPPTLTKVHHHLNAWIHSPPVTPGSRPLPLTLEALHAMGSTQNTLKFHQIEHWMTCCSLWIPQPTPSFFNLLFMAWTCWTHALHLWFTWLLFKREKTGTSSSQILRPINLLSLCHP